VNERNRHLWAERAETVGLTAIVLGVAGTVVSGIVFIASEPNLTPEVVQRLSTNVNGFFEAAAGSSVVAGVGAATALVANTIRK
jgi:hypothetical protein